MTRYHHRAALAAAIFAALPVVSAEAQDLENDKATVEERQAEATVDRFGLLKGTQLQVTTGTDNDVATLGIALPTGPSQKNRFALLLSTPIDGDDASLPASLDALSSGSKATLRFGRFELGRVDVDDPQLIEMVERAKNICVQKQDDPSDPRHRLLGGACANSARVVRDFTPRDYRNYRARVLTAGVTDWGFEASVGVDDFEWIDPVTFIPQEKRRTSWSMAGHFTHYFVKSPTAVTLSATYQRAYKAADEELLCPPNTINPAAECKMARGAAPSLDKSVLLSAGLRHRFQAPDGTLLGLAIAPVVTYDADNDVFGVDVPVYLVPDKEGALTGGVRFGYRSDREDKFTVGVFFGAAFSLWQK